MRKRPARSTANLSFQPLNDNISPYSLTKSNTDSIDPIDWKDKEFSKQKYEVAKVFNCPVWIDLGQNSVATIVSKTLANGLDSGIPLELSINMSMNCFMGPIILFSVSIVLFVLFVSIFCIYSKKKKLNFKENEPRKGFLESLKLPKEIQKSSNNNSKVNVLSKTSRKAKLKGPRAFFAENFQNIHLASNENQFSRNSGQKPLSQPFSQLPNPNLPSNTFVPPRLTEIKEVDSSESHDNYNRNYQGITNNLTNAINKNVSFPNNHSNNLVTSSNLNSDEYIVNNNNQSLTRPYNNSSNINNVILNGHKMSNTERGLINSAFNQLGSALIPSQLTRIGNHNNQNSSFGQNTTTTRSINNGNAGIIAGFTPGTEIRPKTLVISSNLRPDQIKNNSSSPQYVSKKIGLGYHQMHGGHHYSQRIPIEKPEIIRSISPSKLNCLDNYNNHSTDHEGQHTVANTITI